MSRSAHKPHERCLSGVLGHRRSLHGQGFHSPLAIVCTLAIVAAAAGSGDAGSGDAGSGSGDAGNAGSGSGDDTYTFPRSAIFTFDTDANPGWATPGTNGTYAFTRRFGATPT